MAEHGEGGVGHGGADAEAPPDEAVAEERHVATVLVEIDRLLEGFDSRLAAVNRRLDVVIDRRA